LPRQHRCILSDESILKEDNLVEKLQLIFAWRES
jgi:hypothetical protein